MQVSVSAVQVIPHFKVVVMHRDFSRLGNVVLKLTSRLCSVTLFTLTFVFVHLRVRRWRWSSPLQLNEELGPVFKDLEHACYRPDAHVHAGDFGFGGEQKLARLQVVQECLNVTQEGQV